MDSGVTESELLFQSTIYDKMFNFTFTFIRRNRINMIVSTGTLLIETGSRFNIHEVRIPNALLNSDIYFLDGKRKHSVTNDEFGREIVI